MHATSVSKINKLITLKLIQHCFMLAEGIQGAICDNQYEVFIAQLMNVTITDMLFQHSMLFLLHLVCEMKFRRSFEYRLALM